MNYMPLEIWADLLEDQGQDTSVLRAWIESGVISQGCDISFNSLGDGYGYGIGYGFRYSGGDSQGCLGYGGCNAWGDG